MSCTSIAMFHIARTTFSSAVPRQAGRMMAFRQLSSDASDLVLTEKDGRVGIITLNRPKAMNALSSGLVTELNAALQKFDNDEGVAAIVLKSSFDKAFVAGADIKEMSEKTFLEMHNVGYPAKGNDLFAADRVSRVSTPIVAAVTGYALGGGCELAMMCDIIIAAENAKFGQPEITIGTIPGLGGSQRLTRAVGKSKAMEMCLTGLPISAQEAHQAGLVSRVVPTEECGAEAVKTAHAIARHSKPIINMCKEVVNAAFEMTLEEGVHFERRVFHSTFATNDQKEGMGAFKEKRKPAFTDS